MEEKAHELVAFYDPQRFCEIMQLQMPTFIPCPDLAESIFKSKKFRVGRPTSRPPPRVPLPWPPDSDEEEILALIAGNDAMLVDFDLDVEL